MISREKAFEFVLARRDHEGEVNQRDLPEWIRTIREHLQKAEDKWQEGKATAALHHIGSVAAFSIAALEQHGEDIRDGDPSRS